MKHEAEDELETDAEKRERFRAEGVAAGVSGAAEEMEVDQKEGRPTSASSLGGAAGLSAAASAANVKGLGLATRPSIIVPASIRVEATTATTTTATTTAATAAATTATTSADSPDGVERLAERDDSIYRDAELRSDLADPASSAIADLVCDQPLTPRGQEPLWVERPRSRSLSAETEVTSIRPPVVDLPVYA